MARTGFIYNPLFLEHKPGEFHPERPKRLEAILSHLQKSGLWEKLSHYTPPVAEQEIIRLAHSKRLVEHNLSLRGQDHVYLDQGDTVLSRHSIDVAELAAGAGMQAADLIFKDKKHTSVFCATRPPGHHAEYDKSMGFCIFNHIAISAAYCIAQKYIERALIIDWDVHHGNGTQDIFYKRNDVFYFSMHQTPLFPNSGFIDETGLDEGAGFTLNYPLQPGLGNEEYLELLEQALARIEKKFKPDLVLISAGFDAHERDPIGGMKVTSEGFAEFTRLVKNFAQKHCNGRIISILEGGYDLNALARSVYEHLKVLQ